MSTQSLDRRLHTRRSWVVLGFSLALTTVTLYFIFRGIDRRFLARLLATQDRSLLGIAAFFILLQIGLAGERWRAILSATMRDRPPSMLSVQAVFYASIFFNCLPLGTGGGDIARVWLARKFALPLSHLVLSVLVDRIFTVVAFITLALATLPIIKNPFAETAWFVCASILAAGGIGILLLGTIERLLGRWRHQRLTHLILRTAEELQHLTRSAGLRGLTFALASGLCVALAAYCIALSLDIDIGPMPMVAVISLMTLVVALPISVAGWGIREVSLVALLGLLRVDREAALILSVELGLLSTLLSLPGGAIWLTLRENHNVAVPTK